MTGDRTPATRPMMAPGPRSSSAGQGRGDPSRERSTERLGLSQDGVFAIAIALVVIEWVVLRGDR